MRRIILSLFAGIVLPSVATAKIVNVSSRLLMGGSAGNIETAFTIAEGGSQTVLVRAVGPTLSNFGISNAIADPTLQLFSGATPIAANDNWGDSNASAITNASMQVGAFSLPNNSKDAALLANLTPGSYGATLSQNGTGSGAVLSELYTVGGGGFSGISVRGFSGFGDNSLISGFVLTGTSPRQFLLRARAVPGAGGLIDARLQLYSQSAAIMANDNWTSTPDAGLITAYSELLGLSPLAAADSAFLVSLNPGIYTAMLNGLQSGVANFDLYDVSNLAVIPEPAHMALVAGVAALGAVCIKRRRQKAQST